MSAAPAALQRTRLRVNCGPRNFLVLASPSQTLAELCTQIEAVHAEYYGVPTRVARLRDASGFDLLQSFRVRDVLSDYDAVECVAEGSGAMMRGDGLRLAASAASDAEGGRPEPKRATKAAHDGRGSGDAVAPGARNGTPAAAPPTVDGVVVADATPGTRRPRTQSEGPHEPEPELERAAVEEAVRAAIAALPSIPPEEDEAYRKATDRVRTTVAKQLCSGRLRPLFRAVGGSAALFVLLRSEMSARAQRDQQAAVKASKKSKGHERERDTSEHHKSKRPKADGHHADAQAGQTLASKEMEATMEQIALEAAEAVALNVARGERYHAPKKSREPKASKAAASADRHEAVESGDGAQSASDASVSSENSSSSSDSGSSSGEYEEDEEEAQTRPGARQQAQSLSALKAASNAQSEASEEEDDDDDDAVRQWNVKALSSDSSDSSDSEDESASERGAKPTMGGKKGVSAISTDVLRDVVNDAPAVRDQARMPPGSASKKREAAASAPGTGKSKVGHHAKPAASASSDRTALKMKKSSKGGSGQRK